MKQKQKSEQKQPRPDGAGVGKFRRILACSAGGSLLQKLSKWSRFLSSNLFGNCRTTVFLLRRFFAMRLVTGETP